IAFRKKRAQLRYWLWLAASVKFLVPFSLLVSVGSQFEWRSAPSVAPVQFSAMMDQISEPFAPAASLPQIASVRGVSSNIPSVLLCVWICGFLLVAFSWTLQ